VRTPTVLVVDSYATEQDALKDCLRGVPCRLLDVGPSELLTAFERHTPAVVVVRARAHDVDVLETIRELRRSERRAVVFLCTSDGSEALAVAALRAGVKDYFREPVAPEVLAARVRRELSQTRVDVEPARLGSRALVGSTAAARELRERIARIAAHDATVLVTGETGTGKELVASLLHAGSPRRRQRLVSINCAAIPETLLESELFGHDRGAFTGAAAARAGLLEQARGGTVFFDEIGEMSPLAQAKLLRAIESREVVPLGGSRPVPLDVRFVAATNQDPEQAVRSGRLRQDLYFRLNVVRIHVPPLRERAGDIPSLLAHYLEIVTGRSGGRLAGFTDEAVSSLQRYAWPGNVRELKNLVEALAATVSGGRAGVDDLPRDFIERMNLLSQTPDAERERLLATLAEARWNKSRAARQLHCSRMTLYRKLARYHVVDSDCAGRSRK
jgi:DNA-binding NtrC family response regulator